MQCDKSPLFLAVSADFSMCGCKFTKKNVKHYTQAHLIFVLFLDISNIILLHNFTLKTIFYVDPVLVNQLVGTLWLKY